MRYYDCILLVKCKREFAKLSGKDAQEKEKPRHTPVAYCALDTLAMVQVLEKLTASAVR